MATNRPRYTVSLDPELFEQVESFRFQNRFQTRSEATIQLIKLGLLEVQQGKWKKEEEKKEE